MKLKPEDLKKLCGAAQAAAETAGGIIRDFTRLGDYQVNDKGTEESEAGNVVTEVDIACQKAIQEALAPSIQEFDLGWLAEESEDNGSRFDKDYFWCVDPLDGTLPFVQKRPGYAVSIALVAQSGESVIGVVHDPVEMKTYHAYKGGGAFCNGAPWKLEPVNDADFEIVEGGGGSVMSACLALEKAPACFFKKPKPEQGGGCLWDYAATACLFQEIGAWVSDISARPLDLNSRETLYMNTKGVLFATSKAIAESVMT